MIDVLLRVHLLERIKVHLKIMLCFLLLFAQPVYAELSESDLVRPVEIGAGGNIKREKQHRTKAEAQFEWHAHTLWESRYVTEGRDNLSGKSLLSVSSEFTFDKLTFIPWLANSVGTDYSELNLNVIYGFELDRGIELYAGYNHIQSRQKSVASHDNEISLDVAFTGIYKYELIASIYHSFESDGSFMEISAKHGLRINHDFNASFRAVLGANAGYVVDGHDGLNHFQFVANIDYRPFKKLELYTYAGYNRAIGRDVINYAGDVSLDDFFWAGVGFIYRY